MMTRILASVALITFCTTEGRPRPEPRPFPQERRARPWFQINQRPKNQVGSLVSLRKWPLYPQDQHPQLGKWTQGLTGEWIWRENNNPPRNRWKPVPFIKPTGLVPKIAKKPVIKVKYRGPKHQTPRTNIITNKNKPNRSFTRKLVSQATPIERIDKTPRIINDKIRRSFTFNQNSRPINVKSNLRPIQGQQKLVPQHLITGKISNIINTEDKFPQHLTTGKISNIINTEDKFPQLLTTGKISNIINTKEKFVADKEVDGRKIYMFKGSEGIGNWNSNSIHTNSKNLATTTNQLKLQQTKEAQTTRNSFVAPLFTTSTPKSVEITTTTKRSSSSSSSSTAPPFPTRHTTPPASQHSNPIIIISQSSVMQNY